MRILSIEKSYTALSISEFVAIVDRRQFICRNLTCFVSIRSFFFFCFMHIFHSRIRDQCELDRNNEYIDSKYFASFIHYWIDMHIWMKRRFSLILLTVLMLPMISIFRNWNIHCFFQFWIVWLPHFFFFLHLILARRTIVQTYDSAIKWR